MGLRSTVLNVVTVVATDLTPHEGRFGPMLLGHNGDNRTLRNFRFFCSVCLPGLFPDFTWFRGVRALRGNAGKTF